MHFYAGKSLPVVVLSNGWVALGTRFLIKIKAVEGMEIRRQTSVSSFTDPLMSFGLRPGFGFAGITHSLEASKRGKSERGEGETRAYTKTYGQPTASKWMIPRCPQWPWCDSG